jgi:hypothetical protein
MTCSPDSTYPHRGDRGSRRDGQDGARRVLGQQVREEFPDGQLYVDLHGSSPRGRAPALAPEAMGGSLDALTMPASGRPASLDAQAATPVPRWLPSIIEVSTVHSSAAPASRPGPTAGWTSLPVVAPS